MLYVYIFAIFIILDIQIIKLLNDYIQDNLQTLKQIAKDSFNKFISSKEDYESIKKEAVNKYIYHSDNNEIEFNISSSKYERDNDMYDLIMKSLEKPEETIYKVFEEYINNEEKTERLYSRVSGIPDINLTVREKIGVRLLEKDLEDKLILELKNNPNFEYITMSSGDEKNDSNIKNATTVDTKSESAFKVSNVNINTATQTELETLPGIGPSLALKIINYRKENGKFKSIEELKSVNGIGENKYEEIKKYIYV